MTRCPAQASTGCLTSRWSLACDIDGGRFHLNIASGLDMCCVCACTQCNGPADPLLFLLTKSHRNHARQPHSTTQRHVNVTIDDVTATPHRVPTQASHLNDITARAVHRIASPTRPIDEPDAALHTQGMRRGSGPSSKPPHARRGAVRPSAGGRTKCGVIAGRRARQGRDQRACVCWSLSVRCDDR